MPITVTTSPAERPIDAYQVVDNMRLDDYDVTDLRSRIDEAVDHVEEQLGRALITRTVKWTLDSFTSDTLEPPYPPLQSVSEIRYLDTDGSWQVLDSSKYRVDSVSSPGRITPAYGETWPSTRSATGAVEVTMVIGYGKATAVPASIKRALLLLVGQWYEFREEVVVGAAVNQLPRAVDALLAPYRMLKM